MTGGVFISEPCTDVGVGKWPKTEAGILLQPWKAFLWTVYTHLREEQNTPLSYIAVIYWASQVTIVVKNLPANEGDAIDVGLIPGLGRFPWRRKW